MLLQHEHRDRDHEERDQDDQSSEETPRLIEQELGRDVGGEDHHGQDRRNGQPGDERHGAVAAPGRRAGGQAREQRGLGDGQRAASGHREAEEVLDAEGHETGQQRDDQQPILRHAERPARGDHHTGDQHEDGEAAQQALRGQDVERLVVRAGRAAVPLEVPVGDRALVGEGDLERVETSADEGMVAKDVPRRLPDVLATGRLAELTHALGQAGERGEAPTGRQGDGEDRQAHDRAARDDHDGARQPALADRVRARRQHDDGGGQREPGPARDRGGRRRARHDHDGAHHRGGHSLPGAQRPYQRVDDERNGAHEEGGQEVRMPHRGERPDQTGQARRARVQDGVEPDHLHERVGGRHGGRGDRRQRQPLGVRERGHEASRGQEQDRVGHDGAEPDIALVGSEQRGPATDRQHGRDERRQGEQEDAEPEGVAQRAQPWDECAGNQRRQHDGGGHEQRDLVVLEGLDGLAREDERRQDQVDEEHGAADHAVARRLGDEGGRRRRCAAAARRADALWAARRPRPNRRAEDHRVSLASTSSNALSASARTSSRVSGWIGCATTTVR